jgi:ubiquinol-cytochrome c reductase cytochrome b subunit
VFYAWTLAVFAGLDPLFVALVIGVLVIATAFNRNVFPGEQEAFRSQPPTFRGDFLLLTKSHLQSYPCPLQINFFWNLGFTLGIAIMLQILTGILLALHYTSDIKKAYFSVFFLIREVYYGWCLRYFHSSGASFVFLFLFLHIGRGKFYGSYFYNTNTWFSGIILFLMLMATAFLGYVLPFGQMSFWGATVITNLLSPFPCLIEWICGGYCVSSPTLKRFFIFHFVLPFILCGFLIIHLFHLHFHSSNNPLKLNTNNKIPFFPFIFIKDMVFISGIYSMYLLQTHFGFATLSHPDNAVEACALLTPLHIVPEWYFLCQYAMLKAVPNKNAGFIVLLTSIFTLFFLGEKRNLSSFTRLIDSNNGFSISFFFLLNLSLLWIGAQFPQFKFLSHARILTLDFYGVLVFILLALRSNEACRS